MLRCAYRWMSQVVDPRFVLRGIGAYPRYLYDWFRYRRLHGDDVAALCDTYPQLHDRTSTTGYDRHYFYMSAWATRRIVNAKPMVHVDVGGHNLFVAQLSAMIPVKFVDIRPLEATLSGMECLAGSILNLPFADNSLESLSCLHVAEHIGLGRYGDPLDQMGTLKAARELSRCLQPGGNLLFAVPVGKSRVQFNAHRIFDPNAICAYFETLALQEFSVVRDDGSFVENADRRACADDRYACGMFRFTKRIEAARKA